MNYAFISSAFRYGAIALLLLAGRGLSAQPAANGAEWKPSAYTGVEAQDKEQILYEDFTDNSNGWNLTSPSMRMSLNPVNGGSLLIESQKSSTFYKLYGGDLPLDSRDDYEMEIKLRHLRSGPLSTSEAETGLVFGRDNTQNSDYIFGFNALSLLHIGQCRNGLYSNYVNWSYFDKLGKLTYNTLTLRKVGDQWYFFINGMLAHQQEAEPLFGRKIGFLVGGYMMVEVDYLRVYRLRPRDATPPTITLLDPVLSPHQHLYTTQDTVFTIRGVVSDPSELKYVRVNSFDVVPDKNNMFSVTFRVQPTAKPITISAADIHGNSTVTILELQYVPPSPKQGNNYLLVIGIDNYRFWPKLQNAVKDCKDVKYTLETLYTFDREHTFELLNEQASYEGILEMFEHLQKHLTEKDNLLIYYAGHGFYDPVSKLGYWVPWGARQEKVADYLRNSTIHDYLRTINTHHTLLMADACYAGSLLAADRGVINENNRSRWAFASGDLQKVYDGEPGENSPFCKYFLSYLNNSTNSRIRADEMIHVVKAMVERNALQTPVGSPVHNVGDEGGVFIFERRK